MIDLLLSTLASIMVGTIFWLVLKLIDVYNRPPECFTNAPDEPDDGWVEWDGSADHPPISPEDEVMVRYRDGGMYVIPRRAADFEWSFSRYSECDIIAYKVIQ